jgi:hypothetical protein
MGAPAHHHRSAAADALHTNSRENHRHHPIDSTPAPGQRPRPNVHRGMHGDRRPHRNTPGSRRAWLSTDPESRRYVHLISCRFVQGLLEQHNGLDMGKNAFMCQALNAADELGQLPVRGDFYYIGEDGGTYRVKTVKYRGCCFWVMSYREMESSIWRRDFEVTRYRLNPYPEFEGQRCQRTRAGPVRSCVRR